MYWCGVLLTTLRDIISQWLATGRWFSLGTSVSSTNETDHHDIAEILLKVVLNTITLTLTKKLLPVYDHFIREVLQYISILIS